MKQFYILFVSILIISCSKNNDLTDLRQLTTNNNSPSPSPVAPAFVTMNLNGQDINFSSITKERNLALRYFNFSAENDSIKIELKINSINQTGNSTGLILVGLYKWKLYRKHLEGGDEEYPAIYQWLGVYSDKPLTDSIVAGEFSFQTNIPGRTEINKITNGKFRLIF